MSVQGLLVDLDGTLADSMGALKTIFFKFLRSRGIQSSEEEFAFFVGVTLHEMLAQLKAKYRLAGDVNELYEEYAEMVLNAYGTEIKAMPGASEALALAKQKGLKLALVTAASEEMARSFLALNALTDIFDLLVCAKTGEKGKPDPALYVRALDGLSLAPKTAVAIEDSANGVKSALAAGCEVLWLTQEKEVPLHVPRIENWKEIESWLNPVA